MNDNACRFFKMTRDRLLSCGSGQDQSARGKLDGSPSFGMARGYIDGALDGGAPVFEWIHCDAAGTLLPCEVRFVRLPSSDRRLIRASITDITRAQACGCHRRW